MTMTNAIFLLVIEAKLCPLKDIKTWVKKSKSQMLNPGLQSPHSGPNHPKI